MEVSRDTVPTQEGADGGELVQLYTPNLCSRWQIQSPLQMPHSGIGGVGGGLHIVLNHHALAGRTNVPDFDLSHLLSRAFTTMQY